MKKRPKILLFYLKKIFFYRKVLFKVSYLSYLSHKEKNTIQKAQQQKPQNNHDRQPQQHP